MRLSFVYSVRDPDYGPGLLQRMQVSMDSLANLARIYKLDYELIVVEWNPPADKKTIRDSIAWPSLARTHVRFIEVSSEIHSRFGAGMPFLEYIAKNVGIRRAKGDWILACTPDVIFNPNLVHFLARATLRGDCYYRIDRHDVDAHIALESSLQERLDICAKSVVIVNKWDGSFPPEPGDVLQENAGRPRIPGRFDWLRRFWAWSDAVPRQSEVHTNASGDFFLMSKDNWFGLKGYTELTTHAHIDSIMCWTAESAGLRQVVLGNRMRLYHQEHDRSQHHLFPQTDLESWRQKYEDFLQRRIPLIFNDETWGLAGQTLPETIL